MSDHKPFSEDELRQWFSRADARVVGPKFYSRFKATIEAERAKVKALREALEMVGAAIDALGIDAWSDAPFLRGKIDTTLAATSDVHPQESGQ